VKFFLGWIFINAYVAALAGVLVHRMEFLGSTNLGKQNHYDIPTASYFMFTIQTTNIHPL